MKDTFESGGYYHLYNHAIGFENLFREPENYRYFLSRYNRYISPVADTLAYCLMPNHFHFMIKVGSEKALLDHYKWLKNARLQKPQVIDPEGDLEVHAFVMLQFKHFLNGYAQAYNKRYSRRGGLFLRFLNRKKVDTPAYYTRLIQYIHYNAVYHGFCQEPGQWPYSSYHGFLKEGPSRLAREEVLDWYAGREGFMDFHRDSGESNLPWNYE